MVLLQKIFKTWYAKRANTLHKQLMLFVMPGVVIFATLIVMLLLNSIFYYLEYVVKVQSMGEMKIIQANIILELQNQRLNGENLLLKKPHLEREVVLNDAFFKEKDYVAVLNERAEVIAEFKSEMRPYIDLSDKELHRLLRAYIENGTNYFDDRLYIDNSIQTVYSFNMGAEKYFVIYSSVAIDWFFINLLSRYVLLMSLFFIFFIAMTYCFFKWIISAVKKISDAIEKTVQSNYQMPIDIVQNNELQILINSFEKMRVIVNTQINQLEESLEQQASFAGNVAHELQTPITSLQNWIEMFLDTEESEKETKKHCLDKIQDSVNKFCNIVNQLLMLAKMDSKQLEKCLDKQSVNVSKMTAEILETVVQKWQNKNHVVQAFLQDEIITVTSAESLEMIIHNLLDNAFKYTPENGIISIFLSESNGVLEIKVEDNGIGITKEEIKRIFDRFYRVKKDTNAAGLGIGLAVSKKLAEILGGEIAYKNVKGGGSCFIVHLRSKY